MFYAIIAGITLVCSLLLFGGGAYVANTYCKAGIYKAQVTALKRQITKVNELVKEAQSQEDNDNKIETGNKDFVNEIEKIIKSSSDNPECANSEFLRKLRSLR